MAKKEPNLFPGPGLDEEIMVITMNNIKVEGKVYGLFDDVIVVMNKDGNYEVVAKAAISVIGIIAEKPTEEQKEE